MLTDTKGKAYFKQELNRPNKQTRTDSNTFQDLQKFHQLFDIKRVTFENIEPSQRPPTCCDVTST